MGKFDEAYKDPDVRARHRTIRNRTVEREVSISLLVSFLILGALGLYLFADWITSWVGVLVFVLLTGMAAGLVSILVGAISSAATELDLRLSGRAFGGDYCTKCGYDLRRCTEGKCPECGKEIRSAPA